MFFFIIIFNSKQVDNSLQWVTSESDYRKMSSYKNWLGKAPDRKPDTLTCTYLSEGEAGIDQGKWKTDNKCGEMQSYVCEAKPMGSCPPGWILYNKNCYLLRDTNNSSKIDKFRFLRQFLIRIQFLFSNERIIRYGF